ncbi:MAG: hypothetical protein ACFFCS_14775 [Candidatus Hodarchaeota archaeon]
MGRWGVLRLDYLFSVIIPCLIAIYVHDEPLNYHLRTILGWAFLGIAGNVINDMIDKDRDLTWHSKELGAIALGAIALSMLCFFESVVRNPWNLLWVACAIIMILAYCLGLKKIQFVSTFWQVFAEIFFPYFTIKLPSGNEWFWVITLYSFGLLSQFVHESIDKEAISTLSPRRVRIVVIFFSLLTLALGAVLFLQFFDFNIIPFAFVPLATIYIFRVPRKAIGSNIKDVGIIMGNFFMVYFLFILLAR